MKTTIRSEFAKRLALGLAALALAAAPSFAQTSYDLCASDGTVSIGGTSIPIWGYADITGGGACVPGMATLPGPQLTAADGETLTINLSNALSVPVSVFIPGLVKEISDPLAPEKITDGQGRERLTSLDKTVPVGGSAGYSWSASEGTYLYHSGTDLRTQVPMGMYGALVVSGTAYPTVDQEEVLVFSEIDPNLNANPAGFGGARVSTWSPQYYLINGASYDAGSAPIAINTSTDVMLRFVNAGLETFVPTLGGGLYMDLIAEDGNLYPYPLKQYGIELTAGKTMDAILNAGSDGTYTIYDRGLHLANGGMIAKLQAGAPVGAPTAFADSYSLDEDSTLTADGVVPNPAGVLDNDSVDATAAVLVSGPAHGSLGAGLGTDGSFTYQPNPNFFGDDQFSYLANNGAGGPDSNVAIVSLSVNGVSDAPVAVVDSYDVVADQTLSIPAPGVLGNDFDADGDTLTMGSNTAPTAGILSMNADGSFDFDAAGLIAGSSASFDYEACEVAPGTLCSPTATVTINVLATAPNNAPIANGDTRGTGMNTTLADFNIIANDDDGEGNFGSPWIDGTTVVITTGTVTQRGGAVVNNLNGTVSYTPPTNFRGTDTFQYTVRDNAGAISNEATVRVNVLRRIRVVR